ncbi:hypothetical protein ACV334_34110 [Pseudomonas aeruginosa]
MLASAHSHIPTSVPEGLKTRIQVITRMANGIRESESFFLKIMAPFPVKAR